MGYFDIRSQFFSPYKRYIFSSYNKKIFFKKEITLEEMKAKVFATEWVQRSIENLVKKRLANQDKKQLIDVPVITQKTPLGGGEGTVALRSQSEPAASSTAASELEEKTRREVENEAGEMFRLMFSNVTNSSLHFLVNPMRALFTQSYKKIVVNQNQVDTLKDLFKARKGPIIFCPTHRSYVDFLVLSTILFYCGIETPFICAGEDFMGMPILGDILRRCGAFFMRRTFKGDDLYKSIFYEYVR